MPSLSVLETGQDGIKASDISRESRSVAARYRYEGEITEPLITPICQSSVYKIKSVQQYSDILETGGHVYSRLNNETTNAAEATINSMEEGAGTLVFDSGTSALSCTLLCFLKSGDHIVANNPIYSGTHELLVRVFPRYNIDVSWVPAGCNAEEYRKAVKSNTKVLYGETPLNPDMSILDLEAFGKLGQSLDGVLTMVDSTFGTPYLQQPIKLGVDIAIHSCSKYMGGHNDLIAGCATTRTIELWKTLQKFRSQMGCTLAPQSAFLLSRGLKTLPIRMEKHSASAKVIAEFLEGHSKIQRVRYPGLPSHPHHEVAKKQMLLFSGMIMLEMKGGLVAGKQLIENVKFIHLSVSLGGTESLIQHPASMTHGPNVMTNEDRRKSGITDGMVRLSVGIENAGDIMKDLAQALDKVNE